MNRIHVIIVAFALLGCARVTAGSAKMIDGHATLSSDLVTYRWAKADNGAGLISIHDRAHKKQLLLNDPTAATWWQIKLKSGKTVENVNAPCKVSVSGDSLEFSWDGDIRVKIRARLLPGESVLRSRISVRSMTAADGLTLVSFPLVKGVTTLSGDAKNDHLLIPHHMGHTVASPIATGKPVSKRYNIECNLQMTALVGAGRGLYLGEEDGTASEKVFRWTPHGDTLTAAIDHPVGDWLSGQPVKSYESPGDVVFGPFAGDWFDAAQIYRKWAITAPWCRKGTIDQRDDYPRWFVRTPYWCNGDSSEQDEIADQFEQHEYLGTQDSIFHDYYYRGAFQLHDRNPEMFPPRIGSVEFKRMVKRLHDRGIKIIPYIEGWLWAMSTESYRLEHGVNAAITTDKKGSVLWTWASAQDPQAAMCPATAQWRKKMVDLAVECVETYGFDGLYYDYFSAHLADCHNKDHGHILGGGNYWTKSVHDLYQQVRDAVQKINPDAIVTAEDVSESCIDVVDAVYDGVFEYRVPMTLAVYHGYTQVFGGIHNKMTPFPIGRKWLQGGQNGPMNVVLYFARAKEGLELRHARFYRGLVECTRQFALPYLGYGRMLRPPRITGDVPMMQSDAGYGPVSFPVVDGGAWLAPDGSVGLFFVNYNGDKSFEFTFSHDLNEIAGITADKKLNVTRWTEKDGEQPMATWSGGKLSQTLTIEPWGMIALKLEVAP